MVKKSIEEHKSVCMPLLQKLTKEGIPYLYIRDISSCEKINVSSNKDIDILLLNKKYFPLLKSILNKLNYYNLFGEKFFLNLYYEIVVDVHTLPYKRFPLLTNKDLKKVEIIRGVRLPCKLTLLKILLFHPMDLCGFRGKRRYDSEKRQAIQKLLMEVNLKLFLESIRKSCGKMFAKTIEKYLVRKDFEGLYKKNYLFKFSCFINNPKTCLKELFRRFARKIFSKGKIIAIVGIDGTGKTTLIKNLSNFINKYYKKDIVYYLYLGFQGGYILPLNLLARVKNSIIKKFFMKNENAKETNYSSNIILRNNSSLIKRILLFLDFMIRLIKLVTAKYIMRKIVLTDRYVYDVYLYDKHLGKLINWMFSISKPDKVIFLYGNPEVLFERKKEYSPEVLKKHQDLMENILKLHTSNFTKIKTDTISEKDVLKAVLRELSDV